MTCGIRVNAEPPTDPLPSIRVGTPQSERQTMASPRPSYYTQSTNQMFATHSGRSTPAQGPQQTQFDPNSLADRNRLRQQANQSPFAAIAQMPQDVFQQSMGTHVVREGYTSRASSRLGMAGGGGFYA